MAFVFELVFSIFGEIVLELLAAGALELLSGTPAPSRTAVGIPPGPARPATFEELEARTLDVHALDGERLTALATLLALPGEPARALLLLLEDPSAAVRAEAIHALGKARVPEAFAPISRLIGRTPAEEAAIVTALARLGGASAEPRILRFLEHGSPEAQLAAARALRHVGTLVAVERLAAKAQAWFAGELGEKAASAIAGIQRRHARAAPGALSMSSRGLRGELSIAAPHGALSHARKTLP